MKKLSLIIVLGTLTLAATLAGLAVRTASASDHQLSLADLRGRYAGKSVGFTTVCENSGGCGAVLPMLLQKDFVAVTEASFDDAGNFCGTAAATSAPVAGSTTPTGSSTRVITGSVTSFDPASAEGDVSFNIYNEGSCDGATFDSSGATLTTTGSAHVVVSDGANRINGVVRTYIGTAGQFGSVLNKVTLFRQSRDEERREEEGRSADEHQRDPSLEDMQGSYVGKSSGFMTVCINPGGCGASSPIIVPLNFAADCQGTVDKAGNYCATATSASSPVAGSAAGAFVSPKITTGGIISFNRETGEADTTFSIYNGGSCNGAAFDSTGASLLATGTNHLVISEGGSRIDSIVKTYVSATGRIASVVNTTTLIKQRGEE